MFSVSTRFKWRVLLVLWVGVTPSLYGNEDSQLLVGLGLKHLNEGSYEQASQRFKEALGKDPRDATAVFYLMLSQIQLGQAEAALTTYDRYQPEFLDALYLRGVAAFLIQRYPEAKKNLRDYYAAAVTPGAPAYRKGTALSAAYYLGVIAYMENDLKLALEYLNRAEGLDPNLEPFRRLYRGLTYLGLNMKEKAEQEFAVLKEQYRATPARELMEEALAGGERVRLYYGYGQLFEQYDSNPGLVQSDLAVASIYHQDLTKATGGFRSNLLLGVGIQSPGATQKESGVYGRAELSGYGGIHHGNPRLNQFDLLTPQLLLLGGVRASRFVLELPLYYRRIWLDRERWAFYNQQVGAALQGSFELTSSLSLRLGLSLSRQDFGKGNERNGNELNIPLNLWYYQGALGILGGYMFTRYNTFASPSQWRFSSHTLQLAPGYRVTRTLSGFLQTQYTLRLYPNPFIFQSKEGTGVPKKREDSEFSLGATLQWNLSPSFSLQGGYQGIFNSSIPEFTYSRHLATLSLGVQL